MRDAVWEPSLTASKDAPVGGQAVLEGVMMRGVKHWAVAVRKPAADQADGAPAAAAVGGSLNGDAAKAGLGDIEVQEFKFAEHKRLRKLARIPILRGVIALFESLGIGFKALSIAASVQLGEEAEELSGGLWVAILVVAFAFAIGLFFVVPLTLVNLIKHQLGSSVLFWLVEGALRTAMLLGYLALLSRMRDLRRVFEYHGAEHKTISCYEAGDELTPERAGQYSRLHPRCGTSFLLVVMIVSIFVFALAGLHAWWILVLTRIVGLPVVIGISFELIKWAGRNRRRRWVQVLMYPGLQLQRLTTREPSLDQLEVAIASLNAVLAHETPGAFDAAELVGVEVVA
ncbi:MAG TPA: DUF1385 domain-containing protein [Solirubrobacteraceae bacterium]|nr:DUF1385 domain-containing protein [Solirubrobacteraceae bacterium]